MASKALRPGNVERTRGMRTRHEIHIKNTRHARGDVIALRYADDGVAGFQYRDDADHFQRAAAERLG